MIGGCAIFGIAVESAFLAGKAIGRTPNAASGARACRCLKGHFRGGEKLSILQWMDFVTGLASFRGLRILSPTTNSKNPTELKKVQKKH
jgi:hypothetical protein